VNHLLNGYFSVPPRGPTVSIQNTNAFIVASNTEYGRYIQAEPVTRDTEAATPLSKDYTQKGKVVRVDSEDAVPAESDMDFEYEDESMESTYFYRYDIINEQCLLSHKMSLGSHIWLCNAPFFGRDYEDPVFGVKSDVDCIIYKMKFFNNELVPFDIIHDSTFGGLGYIQAGKKFKKYMTFSCDNKYCIIAEHSKFVYIYKKPNMKEPKSIHQIVEIGTEQDSLYGLQVIPAQNVTGVTSKIVILTKDNLYTLMLA